jgi:transcriptional regulator with XRE-family HTH domain
MWYCFFINNGGKMRMRIKDLREDNNLTQEEVANYLNIKQNTYSQYENGQRQLPLPCLIALAKFYKTSTDYILGLTNIKTPYS